MGARDVLRAMLGLRPGAEPREVPLPNVKSLFRSEYQLVLSETALGHTRLCDLLQDQRFSDLCTLRQQGNGYMVVPRQEPRANATDSFMAASHVSLPPRSASLPKDFCFSAGGSASAEVGVEGSQSPPRFCPDEPLAFEEDHEMH